MLRNQIAFIMPWLVSLFGMLPHPSKIFLHMFYFKALLGRRNDKPKDRYSRLDNEIEKSNQTFIVDQQQQQEVSCLLKNQFNFS